MIAHDQGKARAEQAGFCAADQTGEVGDEAAKLNVPSVNEHGTFALGHFSVKDGLKVTDPARVRVSISKQIMMVP